jgi:hypothetical protein
LVGARLLFFFLESAVGGVLGKAARVFSMDGARVYLRGANGWVSRVLEISGVGSYLPPPPDDLAVPAGPSTGASQQPAGSGPEQPRQPAVSPPELA